MNLEQALQNKLKPHAERVVNETHSDFDYLPAVLFLSIEHSKQINDSLASHFHSTVTSIDEQNQTIASLHVAQDKLLTANIASLFNKVAMSQDALEKLTGRNQGSFLEALELGNTQQIAAINDAFVKQNNLLVELKNDLMHQLQQYDADLKKSELRQESDFMALKHDQKSQKKVSYAVLAFSLLSLLLTALMFLKK